ncbi:MAG: rhamnulokinase [Sedimentisphaerales bacterium]|nr:rhamnulokinase [Sedimentisphaerales bacterium]
MSRIKNYLAVDLGAESGRVMLGRVGEGKIVLEEVHRFANGPIEEGGSLRWDFSALFGEIKAGLKQAIRQAGPDIAGIGVDSWGVDFGLVDGEGELIENPYHYRDSRTDGILEKAYELMGRREIYDATGIQFLQFNTIFQLLAMKLGNSPVLERAKHLIMMADLVGYYLCGRIYCEWSLASTGHFLDMRSGEPADALFNRFGIGRELVPDIVSTGTVVGELKAELAKEFGCGTIPIMATGSHDTASAVAAVPVAAGQKWAYLSSGTWSLLGAEISEPIINDLTYEYQFTNEGGVNQSIRLLKNIMGLWPVQECRRDWQKNGEELSYGEIADLASQAKPFAGRININNQAFLSPGDMPAKINRHLEETGQSSTSDKGQLVRIILESLAFEYRAVLGRLEAVLKDEIETLHIVGGGIQNELLCQFAANATGKQVVAGPIEATATGNVMVQAMAAGQIDSLASGREMVRNSFDMKNYKPQDVEAWEEQAGENI